jgi:hypothetical protein
MEERKKFIAEGSSWGGKQDAERAPRSYDGLSV